MLLFEKGDKQVVVNSIVLQYYRLYALLHTIPPHGAPGCCVRKEMEERKKEVGDSSF